MTDKKIVFLSHIFEERELAIHFKSLIEDSFLDLIDVFVSSDDRSIGLGRKWLNNDITHALNGCTVELVLCSPVSVKRPWINFEAGAAGWIRGIPVVPLCHSGMEPGKLPVPLNLLQAGKLTETFSLKFVFPVLANALGSRTPRVDFSAFIQNAVDFEKKYTFWNSCNSAFQIINNINPQIIDALRNQNVVSLTCSRTRDQAVQLFWRFVWLLGRVPLMCSVLGGCAAENRGADAVSTAIGSHKYE
ncbi:hypothetical protein [Desulfobacter sp.]|uniref:hypothetical protein n=1 Tax=Desulfobacter sp. TaxID=2294 RepID=UPI003D148A09